MAEANFFYLEPQPSATSPIGGQPSTTQPSSSVQQTSNVTTRNDGSNLASRVESLENLTSDIRENWAKKGQDANFNNLDVKDRLTANFGKIGGFDVSSGLLSTNKLIIDSNNENIRSTNYIPGVSGFKVSSDLVEAENGVFRGTIKGSTFAYDKISAVGGQLLVSNADTLGIDMSSLDASKLTTKGDTDFAVNDILVMRAVSGTGIKEEWLSISAKNGNEYTVTRDLAGQFTADNNPAWSAGTPVVKMGDSSAPYGGWLRLIGEGTNAPYYSVFQRLSGTYNDYQEVCRLGNLNGFLGYTSDSYGIAMGDSTANLTYDITNGLKLGGTSQTNFYEIIASDSIRDSADANSDLANTTYTKIKEIKYNEIAGTIRVKGSIISISSGTTVLGRFYKNGVAFGTEFSNNSEFIPITQSEDVSVVTGDLIQFYIKSNNGSSVRGNNFRLCYDKQNKITPGTINLN